LGNPGRASIVREWIEKFTILEDSRVRDESDAAAETLLTGADAAELIASGLGELDADELTKLARFENRTFRTGAGEVTLIRVEDLSAPSFVVIFPQDAFPIITEKLRFSRASLETLHKMRIEAGLPSWGSELDERTIPLEARLVDAVSFTKGCYVGQEVIARVHHHKRVRRLLCRMEIEGEGEPASESEILVDEQKVGWITGASARTGVCIALGYVDAGLEAPGNSFTVMDAGSPRAARALTLTPEGDPQWPA
jgi:folate-binding protein YgfZ